LRKKGGELNYWKEKDFFNIINDGSTLIFHEDMISKYNEKGKLVTEINNKNIMSMDNMDIFI
jgi:hypothetical protein